MPTTKETTICALNDEGLCTAPATSSGLCQKHSGQYRMADADEVCSVGACKLEAFGRSMCKAHYMRDWRIRREPDADKRRALRKKMADKVIERSEKPREFESVTIRVTKKAAKKLLKKFPSLYAGARDIVEAWAEQQTQP